MKKKCISGLLLSVLYTSIISRHGGIDNNRNGGGREQQQQSQQYSRPNNFTQSGWAPRAFVPGAVSQPVPIAGTSGWNQHSYAPTGIPQGQNPSGWVSTATLNSANPAVVNTFMSPTTVKNMNDLSRFINYIMPQISPLNQNNPNPQYIAILFTVSTDQQNVTSAAAASASIPGTMGGLMMEEMPGLQSPATGGGSFSDQSIAQAFFNEVLLVNPANTTPSTETADVLIKNNIPLVILDGSIEYGVPGISASTDTNCGIRTFISGLKVYFNSYQPSSYQFMQTTIDTQSTANIPWGQKYWPAGRTFTGSVYQFIESTQKLDNYIPQPNCNPQIPTNPPAESAFDGINSIGHPILIIAAVSPNSSVQQGQQMQYNISNNVYAILLKPAVLYAKENNIQDIMPQLDSFIGSYLTNPTLLGLAS